MSPNGIDNILFGNPDGEWLRAPDLARSRRTDEADAADLALRTDYAHVIRKALQIEDEEAAAIEAARKAVQHNTLDTVQNMRAAAEHLLTFGI